MVNSRAAYLTVSSVAIMTVSGEAGVPSAIDGSVGGDHLTIASGAHRRACQGASVSLVIAKMEVLFRRIAVNT